MFFVAARKARIASIREMILARTSPAARPG